MTNGLPPESCFWLQGTPPHSNSSQGAGASQHPGGRGEGGGVKALARVKLAQLRLRGLCSIN